MPTSGAPRPRATPLTRALRWLGAGIALVAVVEAPLLVASPEEPAWINLLFPATALVYGTAGLVAWRRRPGNGTGPLLVVGAYLWLAAALVNTGVAALVAVGLVTQVVIVGLVVHLLLAFPSGRLVGRPARLVTVAGYLATALLEAPLYLFTTAGPPYDVLRVAARPDLVALGHLVQRVAALAVVTAAAAVMVVRARRADPAQRRVLLPLTGYGLATVLLVPLTAWLLGPIVGLLALAVVQVVLLAGVPVAFACSVLRGGFRRTSEVEALAAWLGAGAGDRKALENALATSLGDPSLRLVYAAPEREGFLDADGRVVEDRPGPGRHRVPVDRGGRLVGAIDYDATLLADPEPVRAAGRVVAIAVDHERLTAELLASREALRESRARLVEAGDTERRRIAQDLHDGLQASLVSLALTAYAIRDDPAAPASVRSRADRLRGGLDGAAGELRRLVHGVMPALLIERGLYAATEDLVDRMPLPTRLELEGADRDLPAAVQQTAYFTVSEGLGNALKHARASRLEVRLGHADGRLRIEVGDDGVGGAAPGGGAGLRGLADRLDVLGGTLRLTSRPGGGTRLVAEVPAAALGERDVAAARGSG